MGDTGGTWAWKELAKPCGRSVWKVGFLGNGWRWVRRLPRGPGEVGLQGTFLVQRGVGRGAWPSSAHHGRFWAVDVFGVTGSERRAKGGPQGV